MHELVNFLISDSFQFEFEKDELLSDPTFSINTIQGGTSTNMVPDRCSIKVDFRTVPTQDHQVILEKLQWAVEHARQKYPEMKVKIEVLNDLSPVKTPANHPFVKLVSEVVQSVSRARPLPRAMTGYTDGSQFVKANKEFPIVILGPGDPYLAHQTDEFVEVEAYLRSIDIYKEIAKLFLGTS
jgi:succinyl-diaminopimelate desuccinylase